MERKLAKYLVLISLIIFTSHTFSQSQIKLLEKAYREDSDSLMQTFFDNWKKDLPVYSLNVYKHTDDTLKEIIEIYRLFYQPHKIDYKNSKALKYFGNDELRDIDSNNFRILNPIFLPNNLQYEIVEKVLYFQWYQDSYWDSYEPDNLRRDTLKVPEMTRVIQTSNQIYSKILTNFRPKIVSNNFFFLDSNYMGILNYFVSGNFVKKDYTKLDSVKTKDLLKKFYKKVDFLSKYYSIYLEESKYTINGSLDYSKASVRINNYSMISNIVFDKTLHYCIVHVREHSSVIYYIAMKTPDGWVIKDKNILWVD
jgi:hypothetical protein